jgi:hypothetical protein
MSQTSSFFLCRIKFHLPHKHTPLLGIFCATKNFHYFMKRVVEWRDILWKNGTYIKSIYKWRLQLLFSSFYIAKHARMYAAFYSCASHVSVFYLCFHWNVNKTFPLLCNSLFVCLCPVLSVKRPYSFLQWFIIEIDSFIVVVIKT